MFNGTVMRYKEILAKKWWSLERFGLTPAKIRRRATNRDEPKIICICIPKAGTHLLERALCLHPRLYRKVVRTVTDRILTKWGGLSNLLDALKPGQILVSHLYFTPVRLRDIRSRGIKGIFIIRDPRDVLVSELFYILKQKQHFLHKLFAQQADMMSCLKLAIRGNCSANFESICDMFFNYSGWLLSDFLIVRFEDLIGSYGGGKKTRQMNTLGSLFDFIGLSMIEEDLYSLSLRLFSNDSPTFRKGQIGGWKMYFTPEIKRLFKGVAGEPLIHYGYENDDQW